MSTPYLGEIKMVSFNFPPKTWALCNGQLLPINQNQALFSLYGTTYGGNGQTTFGLPNLQGRSALHIGGGYVLGATGGETAHTLVASELPTHTHTARVSTTAGVHAPGGSVLPGSGAETFYDPTAAANNTMASNFIGSAGGSQAHNNLMPYLTFSFIVALSGIFPSRS